MKSILGQRLFICNSQNPSPISCLRRSYTIHFYSARPPLPFPFLRSKLNKGKKKTQFDSPLKHKTRNSTGYSMDKSIQKMCILVKQFYFFPSAVFLVALNYSGYPFLPTLPTSDITFYLFGEVTTEKNLFLSECFDLHLSLSQLTCVQTVL